MKALSTCCYEETTVHQPPASGYSSSPPDPIETCNYCGRPTESIDFECPCSNGNSWIVNCDIFDEGKVNCPYPAVSVFEPPGDLPDCPFKEED